MKTKDVVLLLVAVVILLGAGYLGYTQLMPKSADKKTTEVDVIGKIPSGFNDEAMAQLTDDSKVVNFNSPVDLTGLGNTKPFGGQ
ncbi:MAG: hypothetical protein K0S68_965 [Candidatus Saccharibacteria bacterium]|jgi:hypothetical protein|nr:hypothetical protein [Candidatus Saccharibacteria bacterium]